MSEARKLSELTRQQLYDLVWSKPAVSLAKDFGISDVALAKRCKNQNVPKPSLGYWAKRAAGQSPPKKPLPPPRDELFVRSAIKPVGKTLPLPAATDALHPLAAEILKALPGSRLDSHKRANLNKPTTPKVEASKSLAPRIAQAFHVILNAVEPLGICFRKSLSSYGQGFFRHGNDRLFLEIEEALVELNGTYRPRPSWEWHQHNCKLSGRLKFTLNPSHYGTKDATEWVEGDKTPLEEVLARVVTAIRRHFVEAQQRRTREAAESHKRHIEWERQHREWQAKEAIRLQQEAARQHAQALAAAAQTRTQDLLKAAEWWRLHRNLSEFINECRQRWNTPPCSLAVEQETWLNWATHFASTLSPFETGYPDPQRDGSFDPANVPLGGPYPQTRQFPPPPTLPRPQKQVARSDGPPTDPEP